MNRWPALLVTVGVVTSGCAAGGVPVHPAGRVDVVAAESVWGDIAQQIGGRHVEVTSILRDANTDPHLYQSEPRDAAAVSNAALVIENGMGYDSFVDRLLATGARGARRVLSVQRTLHVSGNGNPHLWYWTSRLPQVAAAIADELSAVDPAHAAAYRAGAGRFAASLAPVLDVIATIRQRYAGTPIAYTERVPGYLVQAAGLTLGTPPTFSQALENGNEPSPRDTAAFDTAITRHRVAALLYNPQVADAPTTRIRQLARRAGVPVVSMSETLPAGRSFQSWQLGQDRALLRALGG